MLVAKSLLEALPGIVAAGKRTAEQYLDMATDRNRVTLQTRELVIPGRDTNAADLFAGTDEVSGQPNRLIYGDNLFAMAALLAGDATTPSMRGKIDLIYIDPPFDSKADYRTKITLPGGDIGQKPNVLEQFAYSDTWSDGTASYLAMITPRLVLMRELLADTGSIYVHIDWHVGHYVKLVLDEVFGRENLVNSIVWRYGKMSNAHRRFPQNHDDIYAYARGPRYYFKPLMLDDSEYKNRFERHLSGNRLYFGAVKDSTDKLILGRARKVRKELERELEDSDVLFDFNEEFKAQDDVFYDISIVKGNASENLAFDTQKPIGLVGRILDCACPPGGLAADWFGGSGTLAAAAEARRLRWMSSDLSKPACMVTRKRLIDQDARPFLYQAVVDYQIEQTRSTLGRRFRVGELADTVLRLFGALPLDPDDNVNGSLGQLSDGKTLILADSPNKLTSLTTLRRAQGYRDSKLGGFDKVVVLGWNFAPGFAQDLADLNDDRLEVNVIPPDLLDQLRKKGAEKLAKSVRFSTLQYLKASVGGRVVDGTGEVLSVQLDNYVLLSPDAIPLDDEGRAQVRELMNTEPLALIEYWAVDPNYDGDVFRSVWQDYRGNIDNDNDPLRTITKAQLSLPKLDGPRTVCIRAVDVFGFESEVVINNVELRP